MANEAPYQLSRAALRERYGSRAIKSYGPRLDPTKDPDTGLTLDSVWNATFRGGDTLSPRMAGRFKAPENIPLTGGDVFLGPDNQLQTSIPAGRVQAGSDILSPQYGGFASVRSASDISRQNAAPQPFNATAGQPPQKQIAATSGIDLAPKGKSILMAGEDYLRNIIANAPALPPAPPPVARIGTAINSLAGPSVWDQPIDDNFDF